MKRVEYSLDGRGFMATGVPAAPAPDFSGDWVKGQQRDQAKAENGLPLWGVEVLRQVTEFGQVKTVVAQVRVPARSAPVVEMGPVEFAGLKVTVVAKDGVGLVEYWSADAVQVPAARAS